MRRPALIAFVSFVATLALAHAVVRAALPAITRVAVAHRWGVSRHGVEDLDPTLLSADYAVVGTSLSSGLAFALNERLGRRAFANRARAGGRLADELVAAIESRKLGVRRVFFEVSPFVWNTSRHGELLRYPRHADALAGHVRRGVVLRALAQLGVEGVLAAAADRFAPSRLRISGVAIAWRAPLLAQLVGAPVEEEPPPAYEGDACDVWRALEPGGVDDELLDDVLDWVEQQKLDVVFFAPQLHRATIAKCSGDAIARLDRFIAEERAHLERRGHRFEDFSRAIDDSLLVDFGHFEHEEDFVVLADEWLRRVQIDR